MSPLYHYVTSLAQKVPKNSNTLEFSQMRPNTSTYVEIFFIKRANFCLIFQWTYCEVYLLGTPLGTRDLCNNLCNRGVLDSQLYLSMARSLQNEASDLHADDCLEKTEWTLKHLSRLTVKIQGKG